MSKSAYRHSKRFRRMAKIKGKPLNPKTIDLRIVINRYLEEKYEHKTLLTEVLEI